MEIFDMHVHAKKTTPEPERLLRELSMAGVSGCTVLSNKPLEVSCEEGSSCEERMAEIKAWTETHPDRLFPVLWVHPDEEGIVEKIKIAAKTGVMAFKVMCNSFYVGDTKSMDMLAEIARQDKPVIFHSGILWDGRVSSCYNRPANWEALLDLDGIRFSLGHCSWPWIDECIALYGKFLNAEAHGRRVEMFFDLTPGTPEIYREELLRKLFFVGYDVPNNILYGTDCRTSGYQYEWTKKWLKIDTALFDKFGISEKLRQKIFRDNLFRFLGKTDRKVDRFIPLPDSQTVWSPELER